MLGPIIGALVEEIIIRIAENKEKSSTSTERTSKDGSRSGNSGSR